MRQLRLFITVTLGLGLALALLWTLRGAPSPASAKSELAATPSLARQHAPVIITGGLLSDLIGSPLDEIFVYAQDTTLVQIPFQIDERDTNGKYVAVEDGQLDDNDELVFMATDAGSWIVDPSLNVGGTLITPTHIVTLTDPISDTHAWTYIFSSADLSRTFTADYVSYDGGDDRITSPNQYVLGFDADHGFVDYLTLGHSDPNLVDRGKLRITGTVNSVPFTANEENITQDVVYTIDGPVRVTRVSTNTFSGISYSATLFAYRSLTARTETMVVPGDPAEVAHQRTSMDWNAQASGMTFYDANNLTGTTIDGEPDSLALTPLSRWSQVSGVTGTVVIVSEFPAGLGGTQSTYYRDDDSNPDSADTGDQLSYGDAGLQVDDPNPGTYTLLRHVYFLTGTATVAGADYVDYYDNPIQASVAVFRPPKISVTAITNVASVYPSETATYTLSLTASKGLTVPVTLALQGAPAGVAASFDPNPLIPLGTSQLYITTTVSTVIGTYAMTVTATTGQMTDTTFLTLTVNPRLALAAQPAARTVLPGNTAAYTLSLGASAGFHLPVTLTLQGAPPGAAVSFDPNPFAPPGESQLHVTTVVSTVIGTYAMTVTATSAQVTDTTFLTLTVNPRLALAVQPAARAALPGDTAAYTLSVSASAGFHLPVTLTLQGAPPGAVVSFDPNPLAPPGESQLHVTTAISTVIGTYAMTVTATSAQVTGATFLTLTLNPKLALAVQPAVRTALPGDTAVYTVSVNASEGFTAPVQLALQGAPSHTDASFAPNPVPPPDTSQLYISTTAATLAGTYAMTITGTSGTLTDTANLNLIVASETPSFTLSISPPTRTARRNQVVSYTVVVSKLSDFSQPVMLAVVGLPTDVERAWSTNPIMPDDSSILTLSILDNAPFGRHTLQIVGTADVQVVTSGMDLIVERFKIYLPIILK